MIQVTKSIRTLTVEDTSNFLQLPPDSNQLSFTQEPTVLEIIQRDIQIISTTIGPAGTPGSLWYVLNGSPSAGLGVENDLALDKDTGDIYQKISGTWTIQANLNPDNMAFAKKVDDQSHVNIIYVGEAVPNALSSQAVWRIQEITFTTDVNGNDDIETRWTAGAAFDQIWDNRTGLTYT